jgi:glutathione S-transferase
MTEAIKKKRIIFYDLKHSNNAARIRLWLRFQGLLPSSSSSSDNHEFIIEHKMLSMEDLRKEDYVKINPCRKVPALTTPNGMHLFESSVILNYLEDQFSQTIQKPFLPNTNAEDRAFVHLLVRIHDLYIASPNANQPHFSHTQGCMYLDPTPTPFTPERRTMDAATRAAKLKELYEQLLWLESKALGTPYLAGPELTHADLTWFPTFVFFEFMLPRSFGWSKNLFQKDDVNPGFPKLSQWYQYCRQTHAEFQVVHQEIWEDHEHAYRRGRLSGVQQDVQNHPEFKWKYV